MEQSKLQKDLNNKAKELSKELNGAPVVIIVAGSKDHQIPKTITGKANLGEGREGRLRDLLGILEVSKQIETLRHFQQTKNKS